MTHHDTANSSTPTSAKVSEGDRLDLYQGLGNTLAVAFEFVATPAIFGAIGFLIDSGLGTKPIITIVLFLLAVVGMSLKLYWGYDHNMRLHDQKSSWAKARAAANDRQAMQ